MTQISLYKQLTDGVYDDLDSLLNYYKDYIREVEQRLGICDGKNKAKSSELGMLSKYINSCKRKQTTINVLKEENKKRIVYTDEYVEKPS